MALEWKESLPSRMTLNVSDKRHPGMAPNEKGRHNIQEWNWMAQEKKTL